MRKTCPDCKKRKIQNHFNSKWCERCAYKRRASPAGTMTRAQIKNAKELTGKKPRAEIAKHVGVSVSNLRRSMPGHSFWFKNGKYVKNKKLVKKVLDYYFKHGKPKTVEKFKNQKNVNVKCIVDRPEYYGFKRKYRQKRWTAEQLNDAIKMAGLVSFTAQKKYFDRPGAKEGSLRKLWASRLGGKVSYVNGLGALDAKFLIKKDTPKIKVKKYSRPDLPRKDFYLWVDIEKNLKAGSPKYIRDLVKSAASFQRWIWRSNNPRKKIIQIISKLDG